MSRRGRRGDLSTTSYAILGLLAIKPWTTYELAQQMERTLANWWPRARSMLFEEPKRLVDHGLARASRERTGKRPRTVYTITPAGRRALKTWLKTPPAPPVLEAEHLTKLHFADHGTKQDAVTAIDAMRAWAVGELGGFADAVRPYLSGGGPFPERVAVNMIVGRFMLDFYTLVYAWSVWASDAVADWPDDPAVARPDWSVMEEIVRRGDEVRRVERAREGQRRRRA